MCLLLRTRSGRPRRRRRRRRQGTILSPHEVDVERRVDRALVPFRLGELQSRYVVSDDRVLGEAAPVDVGVEVKLLERVHFWVLLVVGRGLSLSLLWDVLEVLEVSEC